MAGSRKLPEKQPKKTGGTSCPSPAPAGTAVNQKESELARHLLAELQKINQKLDSMEGAFGLQQKKMTETAEKVDDIAKKCLASAEEVQIVKKKVFNVEKHQEKQDNKLLMLQMEKSNLILRFQGLREEDGEDLRDILAAALAPLMGNEAEKIKEEMDLVYRAYSNFTRKNKLPAEVVVKFP